MKIELELSESEERVLAHFAEHKKVSVEVAVLSLIRKMHGVCPICRGERLRKFNALTVNEQDALLEKR